MKVWGLVVAAFAVLASGCGESFTASSAISSEETDAVVLVDEIGQDIQEESLVATIGTYVDKKAMITVDGEEKQIKDVISPSVLSRIYNRYLGFKLDSANGANGHAFTGKLNLFWALGSPDSNGSSIAWPQAEYKDQSWEEARKSAKALALVKQDDNLRIYHSKMDTESNPNGESVLTIFYISPESGKRTSYLYRGGKVYGLTAGKRPKSFREYSMYSIVVVTEVYQGKVTEGDNILDQKLPAKGYAKSLKHGRKDLAEAGVSAEMVTALSNIADAAGAGSAIADADWSVVNGEVAQR